MAENNQSMNSINLSQPVGGMSTDTSFQNQVKNSIRFGLNSVLVSIRGDRFSRSNENSNEVRYHLPQGYVPLGKRFMGDGRTALLLVKDDESASEIGIGYSDGRYETIVNDSLSDPKDKLNFKLNRQIDVVYSLRRGCEDTIYFTDDYNEPRVFNFSKPYNYQTEDGLWSSRRFSLIKYLNTTPKYENIEVLNSGGNLKPGSYNVAIQLLDEDYNPTEWLLDSQLIYIYNDLTNKPFLEINGSIASLDEGFDFPNTSKSIRVQVDNLDTNFTYYRLAFIEANSGSGIVSNVKYSPVISVNQKQFIYTGDNFSTTGTTEEILFFNERIYKAKHIEILDNTLILGDTKGSDIDFCKLQKYASRITVDCVAQEVLVNNIDDPRSPKNPTFEFGDMTIGGQGYMPGEIYSFGIFWEFDDGSFSPVYHIPGKSGLVPENHVFSPEPNVFPMGKDNMSKTNYYVDNNSCNNYSYWGLDSENIPLEGNRVRHHRFPFRSDIGLPMIQEASTSGVNNTTLYKVEIIGQGEIQTPCTQEMIDAEECSVLNVAPNFTTTIYYTVNGVEYSTTLVVNPMEWVGLASQFRVQNDSPYFATSDIIVTSIMEDGVEVLDQSVSPKGITYTTTIKDILYTSETKLYKTSILGAKFSNITYPSEEELNGKKVVGYHIVRNERTEVDKTVLDTAVLTPTVINSRYISHGLLNPQFSGTDNRSKRVFGVISPEHKFHGREYSTFTKLKVEGYFEANEVRKSNIRYDDVYDGSSYDPENHKKGNPDGHPEDNSPTGRGMDGWSWQCIIRDNIYTYVSEPISVNIPFENIEEVFYLDALGDRDINNGVNTVFNIAADNKIGIIQLDYDFNFDQGKLPYVIITKDNDDPYPNFRTAPYYRDSINMLTGSTAKVFGGDTVVSSMRYVNTMFWENRVAKRAGKTSAWKTIAGVALVIVGAVLAFFTAGATTIVVGAGIALIGAGALYVASGIKQAAVMKAYSEAYDKGLRETALDDFVNSYYRRLDGKDGPSDDEIQWIADCATDLFFDSSINMYLRTKINGSTPSFLNSPGKLETGNNTIDGVWEFFGKYYVKTDPKYPISALENHIAKKMLAFDGERDDSRSYLGVPLGELYKINPDYERGHKQKVYSHLAEEYDCCSDCNEIFSQRIHYSTQSFQEELTDNFRVFLPNNYKDIQGETGPITNLFTINNDLFIHTRDALYKMPKNYQERVTDEIVSFIGTGSLFEMSPIKVIDDDTGNSAGTQHKWGSVKTPAGYVFVCESQAKIYLYGSQGLKPISNIGMRGFFNENLKVNLDSKFKKRTGFNYPFSDNVSNPFGTGYILVYDSKFNRVLITKKDNTIHESFFDYEDAMLTNYGNTLYVFPEYEMTIQEQAERGFEYLGIETDSLKFGRFTVGGYEVSYIPGIPIESFKEHNLGWTMSYSLEEDCWISYHSYLPDFYISTPNQMFSYKIGNSGIWEHNIEGSYQTFYGEYYPFIIEYVSNKDAVHSKIYDYVKVYLESQKFSFEDKEYYTVTDVFFNKMIAYNSRQSTGLLNIKVKNEDEGLDYLANQVKNQDNRVIKAKYAEGYWNLNELRDYRSNYESPIFTRNPILLQGEYYIDKEVNESSFNYDKPWYQLEPLRDKYLVVRLIFDKFANVKLLMNFSLESETQSIR